MKYESFRNIHINIIENVSNPNAIRCRGDLARHNCLYRANSDHFLISIHSFTNRAVTTRFLSSFSPRSTCTRKRLCASSRLWTGAVTVNS